MEQETLTFQGVPIKFWNASDPPPFYVFNPEAQVGPHKGVQFFEAMVGYRIPLVPSCNPAAYGYNPWLTRPVHLKYRPARDMLGRTGAPA